MGREKVRVVEDIALFDAFYSLKNFGC